MWSTFLTGIDRNGPSFVDGLPIVYGSQVMQLIPILGEERLSQWEEGQVRDNHDMTISLVISQSSLGTTSQGRQSFLHLSQK